MNVADHSDGNRAGRHERGGYGNAQVTRSHAVNPMDTPHCFPGSRRDRLGFMTI